MKNLTQLMDIEIRNPVNCLKLLMKELGIKQKIRNEVWWTCLRRWRR